MTSVTEELLAVTRDPDFADPEPLPRRLGVIVPSINSCVEPEFVALLPAAVSLHVTRLSLPSGAPDELRAMAAAAGTAARLLAHLDPAAVLFHCTAATTALDADLEPQIRHDLAAEVSCPVLTTGQAALQALRHLGVKTVALVTPYTEEVTAAEAAFLERNGLDVATWAALSLTPDQFARVSPRAWTEIACRVDTTGAEAVFLSCANIRALPAIPAIEERTGLPVVTSNQVALWGVLRALDIDTPLAGAGRLLGSGR